MLRGIGGALTNNATIQILGLANMVKISSELTWQHTQSEFKTSNCRKRRWDPELGLVLESDMASPNYRPENWRRCGSLLSLPAPGKAVPKTDVCLHPNPLSPSFIYSACFVMIQVSRKPGHGTECCSELRRDAFPLWG